MCGPAECLQVAERWAARWLVPYAAGGAPWFWLRGLGPCLGRPVPARAAADPPPCAVSALARRRPAGGPVVRELLAGESLAL